MKTYFFYTDPGHGWLEVPRELLHDLGIADRVSEYSYQRGDSVYLEEDCDYFLFYQAMKDAKQEYKTATVNEPHADSFVRSLLRYQVEVRA